MTWRLKVQGVVLSLVVLAALALASGATWIDGFVDLTWSGW
jgi:hypothetical protein